MKLLIKIKYLVTYHDLYYYIYKKKDDNHNKLKMSYVVKKCIYCA